MADNNKKIANKRKHIDARNIVTLIVFPIVIVGLVFAVSYAGKWAFDNAIIKINTAHIDEMAAHDVKVINSSVKSRLDTLESIAEDIAFRNEMSGTSIRNLLSADAVFFNNAESLLLVSEDGAVYFDNNAKQNRPDILEICINHEDRFVECFDNGDEIIPGMDNEYVLFGVRIAPISFEGHTYQYLCSLVNPMELENGFNLENFEGKGFNSVIDRGGNYVLSINRNSSIKDRGNFFTDFGNVKDFDSVEMLRRKVISGAVVTTRADAKVGDDEYREYYLVFTPIEELNWFYVTAVPSEVFDAESESLMRIAGYLLGILALAMLTTFPILIWSRMQKSKLREKEATDILNAQLKEKQAELEEALYRAQSSDRAKTTFLNNMSHDIRTPMNAIIGYTRLASGNIDNSDKVSDYLFKIGQSSEHLLALINDVLDMSRIESGAVTLEKKAENLEVILDTLKSIVQADMDNKQLDFNMNVDIDDKYVVCDKLRLNQVLLNVLSNSIKYTESGGKVSLNLIQIGTTKSGYGMYEFRINDNGMGMSREFVKTIFEPFTRMKSSTVSGIQGTGLGMAITKNIVDMMDGDIDVDSKEGEGTKITIYFEFLLTDEKEVERAGKGENASYASDGPEYDFTGKKILLVEDNEMNREIAQEILEEVGLSIDIAEDGTVAVEKMKDALPGQYDLILMDVQMPVMNGYEATRAIRALPDEEIAGIPIVAMTANAFEEDRQEALRAGMDAHLTKPIEVDKLKALLAQML